MPVFNQGLYAHGPSSELPIRSTQGSVRTIQSSGCGLCALTAYLRAADLMDPAHPDQPIAPDSLNLHLQSRCRLLEMPVERVYAADGAGALRNDSADLWCAINDLARAADRTRAPDYQAALINPRAAPGAEIADLTVHIDSGRPAIIGVGIQGSPGPLHQVLVVGYARVESQTYYVINDSGFPPMDGYVRLTGTAALSRQTVLRACASPERDRPYTRIFWCLLLSGLEYRTALQPWTRP